MDVRCVVDNAVQRSSPFWGEHGVAFLISTANGRVLFDTGRSGTVLLHNLNALDVPLSTIDAVALSHAHYDHSGGLPALLELMDSEIPLYANPDLFRKRYSIRNGEPESVGMPMTREDLTERMKLRLDSDPQQIISGVWTTGTIVERPETEGTSERHLMHEGDDLVRDAYLDDMALVLDLDDRVALLCGCCHAGLLNTMAQVERALERPIGVIAGGMHLTGATEEDLDRVCAALTGRPALTRIYPNHCTGEAAFVRLTSELGSSRIEPCPAGGVLSL